MEDGLVPEDYNDVDGDTFVIDNTMPLFNRFELETIEYYKNKDVNSLWLEWNEKFILCRKQVASRIIEIMATSVKENNDLLSDTAKRKKSNIAYNETESEVEIINILNADGSLKIPGDVTNGDRSNTFSQNFPGSDYDWNAGNASTSSKKSLNNILKDVGPKDQRYLVNVVNVIK